MNIECLINNISDILSSNPELLGEITAKMGDLTTPKKILELKREIRAIEDQRAEICREIDRLTLIRDELDAKSKKLRKTCMPLEYAHNANRVTAYKEITALLMNNLSKVLNDMIK